MTSDKKILFCYTFSKERPKVMNNILEAIGMTPLVKLNHIPQSLGVKCQMCKFIEILFLNLMTDLAITNNIF